MTTKHASGPWTIEGGRREHDYEIHADGWHLFTIVDAGTCSCPSYNARLVAAAPELLDALRNLLAWAVVDNEDDFDVRNTFGSAVIAAEEAIAKATGETP